MAALPFSQCLFLLLLLFFMSQSTLLLLANAAKCHPDDESALLSFKSAVTADPSGMLSTWKPATDCCTWSGVTCQVDNRVTTLSLYGNSSDPKRFLSATISPSLSKLGYLDGIYFFDLRNVTGTFPTFLSRLRNLRYIYIENSNLYGPLPENVGQLLPSLKALSLAGNRFSGRIPSSISALGGLSQLNLGQNSLSGGIPAEIGRLKNLTLLSIAGNRLSGKIPDLSSLSELRVLRLSQNSLVGEIPSTISNLSSKLIYLELGHNKLTGKIPSFLGNFKSLDTLDLSSNFLKGVVPKSFRNLTKIFNLNLSSNNLVDPFPEMEVKGIESLDLSHNRFNLGRIPTWVTSSPIIYSLKLVGCGIKMNLSEWRPKETYFYDFIDLSENGVWGSPVELINRTDYLVGFWGAGNRMRFDMGELRLPNTMKFLDLSRNLVFGKVPGSISGLKEVNLSYNHLCGRIPATKFPATAFVGNDCLCGSPLSPCKK